MSEDATITLYDYYKKLIPDTIIFDEVERIAWQHSIVCGSFDSRGTVDDNGLFFYAEGVRNGVATNAKRLFLKVYAGGVNGIDNYNTVYLKEDLAEGNSKSFQYIIIDSADNITLSTTSVDSIILGVKF
jgi:hypothetical protein